MGFPLVPKSMTLNYKLLPNSAKKNN